MYCTLRLFRFCFCLCVDSSRGGLFACLARDEEIDGTVSIWSKVSQYSPRRYGSGQNSAASEEIFVTRTRKKKLLTLKHFHLLCTKFTCIGRDGGCNNVVRTMFVTFIWPPMYIHAKLRGFFSLVQLIAPLSNFCTLHGKIKLCLSASSYFRRPSSCLCVLFSERSLCAVVEH